MVRRAPTGVDAPVKPRYERSCGYCSGRGFITKACPVCGRYRLATAEELAASDSLWDQVRQGRRP